MFNCLILALEKANVCKDDKLVSNEARIRGVIVDVVSLLCPATKYCKTTISWCG